MMTSFVTLHQQEAIDLLETLSTIPAPTGAEGKRSAFVCSWFQARGGDAHLDEVGNVICRVGHRNGGFVGFSAHLDIVEDSLSPLPLTKDGTIWCCPGIGDDTANLVNLMMAFLYAKEQEEHLATDLLFVADVGEEGRGNLKGTRALFSSFGSQIKAFYSFDLYYPNVYAVPVGSHRYEVRVSTKGGHSYTDFGSPNAIVEAANLIGELSPIRLPEETTWNVGTIKGGTTVNSIPSSVVFTYEYRSTKESSLAKMKEAFLETLGKVEKADVSYSVSSIGERPAMGPVDACELRSFTERTKRIVEAATGMEPVEASLSSDSNVPLSLGVVSNTVGTVLGGGAHTKEEWVDITSLPVGMKIALGLVSLYIL